MKSAVYAFACSVMFTTAFAQQRVTIDQHVYPEQDPMRSVEELNRNIRWYVDTQAQEDRFKRQLELQREQVDLQRTQMDRQLTLDEKDRERRSAIQDNRIEGSGQKTHTGSNNAIADNDPLGIRSTPVPKPSDNNDEIRRLKEENAYLKGEIQEIKRLLTRQQDTAQNSTNASVPVANPPNASATNNPPSFRSGGGIGLSSGSPSSEGHQ